VQVQDELLHARRAARAIQDRFGHEDFADVVEHGGRGQLLEARVCEVESATRDARETRDADGVFVGGGARASEARDEYVRAVRPAHLSDRLEVCARALEIVCPAIVEQPDGGRRARIHNRQLFLHPFFYSSLKRITLRGRRQTAAICERPHNTLALVCL
jgi:hypothetical protein